MRDGCVFCDYAGPNVILWETPAVYAVEPLRQVTPGHTLIIPREHAADFADDPAVTAAVFRGAAEYAQAHGIEDANLITSRGLAASQTVFHVHVHVLPRTWDDSVTLPWGNPNQRPRTRYLIDLRPGPGVSGGTVTRAALNAREARGIVAGEYPGWQIGCVRPMFTKEEH